LEKDGFAVDEQVIMFGGKPLEDEVALSSLSELSTLDVDLRMLGGLNLEHTIVRPGLYINIFFSLSLRTTN
jgi:hypothetical protein